MLSIHR